MEKKRLWSGLSGVALALSVLASAPAVAAVPSTLSHQGYLTDAGGPVSGTVSIAFALYDQAEGGAALWTETQSVSVTGGSYSVVLGSVTPLSPSTVPFDRPYWLGVTVGADAEMSPRLEFTSVGYSLRARTADNVVNGGITDAQITGPISGSKVSSAGLNAESLGGTPASGYLKTGTIYDSGTNIGIGTTSPVAKLSVAGAGFLGDYIGSSTWGVLRFLEDSTVRSYLGYGDPGGFLLNSLADSTGLRAATGSLHLTANVDATKGITVSPTGNVGVGTTAPANRLSVIDAAMNDTAAVYGEHAPADYYGIGVSGKGGYKGVVGTVAATGSSTYYGVQGSASTSVAGPTTGASYGGHFRGAGAYQNYGVYGTASSTAGTGTTYGGYFSASGALNNYGIYASGSKNYLQGSVGLGTTTPSARLHLKGGGFPDSFMYLDTTAAGQDAGFRFYENGTVKSHLFWGAAAQTLKLYGTGYSGIDVTSTGNVGIGTQSPSQKLQVAGNYLRVDGGGGEQAYLGGDGWGGDVQIGSLNNTVTNVAVFNPTSGKYMALYVGELHIMGGADLAEPFRSTDAARIAPGMVVAIDATHPGQLTVAKKSYDKAVAGIVSGANGIKPGVTMVQEGTEADGSIPVALTGRVYAMADASYGRIEPGDLLTTSDTPGHAMKVGDYGRAQGAIIGKAMSSLSQGTGRVLVLVTLQ